MSKRNVGEISLHEIGGASKINVIDCDSADSVCVCVCVEGESKGESV